MINENLPFIAVLFVNGCPVGIINRFGFIVSIPETGDIYYPSKNGIVSLPYHLKSSNRESVRFYEVPYMAGIRHVFVDDIVKSFKRIELQFESLPVEIIEQRQKNLTIENQRIKTELEERQNIERVKEALRKERYKNWWQRSESENSNLGLYNGD